MNNLYLAQYALNVASGNIDDSMRNIVNQICLNDPACSTTIFRILIDGILKPAFLSQEDDEYTKGINSFKNEYIALKLNQIYGEYDETFSVLFEFMKDKRDSFPETPSSEEIVGLCKSFIAFIDESSKSENFKICGYYGLLDYLVDSSYILINKEFTQYIIDYLNTVDVQQVETFYFESVKNLFMIAVHKLVQRSFNLEG